MFPERNFHYTKVVAIESNGLYKYDTGCNDDVTALSVCTYQFFRGWLLFTNTSFSAQ